MKPDPKKLAAEIFGTNLDIRDPDFTIEGNQVIRYIGAGGEAVVPNGIKTICEDAFKGNTTVTSVYLPDSVKFIDSYAFAGCTALKK